MAISASFNKPFAQQLAALRERLKKLVPTKRWDELSQAQHQRAFAVAGAQKAQLLADLAQAVDKAIAEGKSIQWFIKNFDPIAARHGWAPKGSQDWRARVIYDTNISTSYAAGRLSQLEEGGFPLWMYKHSHLALDPRPEHIALDGIVRPKGDPFWQQRYPPRGFGCKCRVVGVRSAAIAKRLGGKPDAPLPEWIDAINPKTGLPVGVDKGWGAAPGKLVGDTAAVIQHLTRQAAKLPEPLKTALLADLLEQASKRKPPVNPAVPGAAATDLTLISEAERAKRDGDARAWVLGQNPEQEYLLIYDAATGKEIVRHTNKTRNKVAIPEEAGRLLDNTDKALVLHHNHPDAVALSMQDLEFLQRAGVYEVVAHGKDGAHFAAQRGKDYGWVSKVMAAAHQEMVTQAHEAARRGVRIPDLDAHLFNLALDRAGIISYRYQLTPAQLQRMAGETSLFERMIRAVTDAITRAKR